MMTLLMVGGTKLVNWWDYHMLRSHYRFVKEGSSIGDVFESNLFDKYDCRDGQYSTYTLA